MVSKGKGYDEYRSLKIEKKERKKERKNIKRTKERMIDKK